MRKGSRVWEILTVIPINPQPVDSPLLFSQMPEQLIIIKNFWRLRVHAPIISMQARKLLIIMLLLTNITLFPLLKRFSNNKTSNGSFKTLPTVKKQEYYKSNNKGILVTLLSLLIKAKV